MTKKADEVPDSTIVDDVALRAAIRVWMYTSIVKLHTIAGERQDLYLKLISMAVLLPYEKVVERFRAGDPGLVEARRKTKRIIFGKLMHDPSSILVIHDHVLVHENHTVESPDEPQELESRAR